jgi:hypothetical protein
MLFGALGARDRLLDRGEPVGVLPGAAQSVRHQTLEVRHEVGPDHEFVQNRRGAAR